MAGLMLRAAFAAAAVALFLGFSAPSASAQPAPCAGQVNETSFGQLCFVRTPLPAITEEDYGLVNIYFTPPPQLSDVIPERELRGTWLSSLWRRTGSQRVRSAVIFLEVRAIGGDIPATLDEQGQNIGVALGVLPLAVYQYNSQDRLEFSQVQSFLDRSIGPRLVIEDDTRIIARIRTTFSQQDPTQVIQALAPLVQSMTALGVEGAVMDLLTTRELIQSASAIEGWIRSANNVQGTEGNFVDLSFNGVTQLEFSFQLDPRARRGQTPRPRGLLRLSLDRRPSLFTRDVLPGGSPGDQRPNYRTEGQLDSVALGRILSNGPTAMIQRDPELAQRVRRLQHAAVPPSEFDEICRDLRARLEGYGLSLHDATAVAWAVFVSGDSAERSEIQNVNCVQRDLALWRRYGFAVPATRTPSPPTPSEAALRQWIEVDVTLALLRRQSTDGLPMIRRLFANQVRISIAPGTLYDVGDEPRDEYLSGDGAARALRPLRVGCRFVRPGADTPNLGRLSVLGRREDNNQLLTLTIDYAGKVGGGIEIVGLAVEPTPETDFEVLARTPQLDQRCLDRALTPPPR